MKKPYVFIVSIVLLVSLLSACNGQSKDNAFDAGSLEKSIYKTSEQSADISMKVKEYFFEIQVEKFPLTITNHSDKEYTFGIEPILEVESDETWYVLPLKEDAAWDALGYILPANGECEEVFDIDSFYGKLSVGKYRVVKRFFSDTEVFAIADFEIVDQPPVFTGALEAKEDYVEEIYGSDDIKIIQKILTSYPEDWNPSDAVEDGCFVGVHGIAEGGSYNVWETFYAEVTKGNDAGITIVQYTVEGDAIPHYVSYKDGSFYSFADISRDKYGADSVTYYDGSYQYLRQFDDDGTIIAILSDIEYESMDEYNNDTDENREKTVLLFSVNKY